MPSYDQTKRAGETVQSAERARFAGQARHVAAGLRPARQSGPTGRDRSSVKVLHRRAGNALVARLLAGDVGVDRQLGLQPSEQRSPVFDVIGRGGGHPLDPLVRQTMEGRLGAPLGSVRVHVDARSTESVQAKAFTVGEEIVVHPRHSASSPAGRQLLAHEAVHVVQQRSGPVSGTPVAGGISLSDPSDRFEREAEATARHVSAEL